MGKNLEKPNSPSPGIIIIANRIVDSGLLAQMKGSELKVYLAIARHRNQKSKQSFPSLFELARAQGHVSALIYQNLKNWLAGRHIEARDGRRLRFRSRRS